MELAESDVNWSIKKGVDAAQAAAAFLSRAAEIRAFVNSMHVKRRAGTGSHWLEIRDYVYEIQPRTVQLVEDTFLDADVIKWLVQQKDHRPEPESYLTHLETMAAKAARLADRLLSREQPVAQPPILPRGATLNTATDGAVESLPDYDVFISHASQDKDAVARPLAEQLTKRGYRVWFDEFVLRVGSSLTGEINKGLARSRHGIIILSPAFFERQWTEYELKGLVQREFSSGRDCILPVWHNIDAADIVRHAPALADKFATNTSRGLANVVEQLCAALGTPSLASASPGAVSSFSGLDEEDRCPNCGAKGEIYGYEGSEGDEFAWFECHICGHFQPLSQ